MISDISDPRNLQTLLLLLAVIASAATALRASLGGGAHAAAGRVTLAAAAWVLVPWFPVSHLPLRLGTLVAERTMYLPSVGVALLLFGGGSILPPWAPLLPLLPRSALRRRDRGRRT